MVTTAHMPASKLHKVDAHTVIQAGSILLMASAFLETKKIQATLKKHIQAQTDAIGGVRSDIKNVTDAIHKDTAANAEIIKTFSGPVLPPTPVMYLHYLSDTTLQA